MSIKYEAETSSDGRSAVIRSPDLVLPFPPLYPSGKDQGPGATHRVGERCPSHRHEHDFEQHRCAGQHFAGYGKMKARVPMLLAVVHLDPLLP